MFHYVYVLQSNTDKLFYIGYSQDLQRRLKDHIAGKNVSTRNRRPLELIFYEAYRQKSDALRREAYFKTTKGKSALKIMLRDHMQNQARL